MTTAKAEQTQLTVHTSSSGRRYVDIDEVVKRRLAQMKSDHAEPQTPVQGSPCKTPIEDLRQAALKHYDEVSSAAHSWQSVIPRAINEFYDREAEREGAAIPAPVQRH